jgi:hypothetical protein
MANKTHGLSAEEELNGVAETPAPLDVNERLLRIQERQLELQEAALKQQQAQSEVQKAQLKQTAPKDNGRVPLISVFNPRGEKDFPMPVLKCEFWAPWRESPTYHSFDREEVELVNLLEPGQYTVELTDGSPIQVSIVGVRNSETGKLERLSMHGAKDETTGHYSSLFTNERRQIYPSLKEMLRQMIGEPADSVMTMRRENALIASGQLSVSQGE